MTFLNASIEPNIFVNLIHEKPYYSIDKYQNHFALMNKLNFEEKKYFSKMFYKEPGTIV